MVRVMALSAEELAHALDVNGKNPSAIALAPALRALLGEPTGAGYTSGMIPLVAELQESLGVKSDGIVGPFTAGAVSGQGYLSGVPCESLWPAADADGPARRAHFLAFCRMIDAGIPRGRSCVLGIRGAYPLARATHRMIHARRFDDTFVLISDDDAVMFRGATHAYQRNLMSSGGAVASIRPGSYVLKLAGSDPPIFNVARLTGPGALGDIPAFRDVDHDGVISESEAVRALTGGVGKSEPGLGQVADEVQFHPGYDTIKRSTGKPFSSIACQTAPLADLQRLLNAGNVLDFVLANAADLAQLGTAKNVA